MGFRPPCLPKKECTTDHDIQALPHDPYSSYTFQTPASMVSYPFSLDNSSYPQRLDGGSTSSKDDDNDDDYDETKPMVPMMNLSWWGLRRALAMVVTSLVERCRR